MFHATVLAGVATLVGKKPTEARGEANKNAPRDPSFEPPLDRELRARAEGEVYRRSVAGIVELVGKQGMSEG